MEPEPDVEPPTDELPEVLPPALDPLDSANAGAAASKRADTATARFAAFIVSVSSVLGQFHRRVAEGGGITIPTGWSSAHLPFPSWDTFRNFVAAFRSQMLLCQGGEAHKHGQG
jgi:hypothetical protein